MGACTGLIWCSGFILCCLAVLLPLPGSIGRQAPVPRATAVWVKPFMSCQHSCSLWMAGL